MHLNHFELLAHLDRLANFLTLENLLLGVLAREILSPLLLGFELGFSWSRLALFKLRRG